MDGTEVRLDASPECTPNNDLCQQAVKVLRPTRVVHDSVVAATDAQTHT